MSEFLGEAQILIRPNTDDFRRQLETQLRSITRGIPPVQVPVTAVPDAGATQAVQQSQAKAAAQVAAANEQVARSAAQVTGVQQEQIAVTQRLTTAQVAEARTNQLLAQSNTQLAEAETIASLKTTELAANRARLAASSRAVATAERAVLASLTAENAALTLNARQTLANAQSQELLFQERVKNTIAANAHAAALQREAASEALVARGAGSTALAMAGARGATLAASSGFLVGAAAAVFFAESIRQAVDAEESFRRASFLLGEQLAGQLAQQAEGIGEAFALDDDDVLKFEVQIGKILKAVQLTDQQIASFSPEIVKLAADIAAFNRVPVDDTLKAIQSGLAGNTRGLRQFGVLLDSATTSQRALAQTGKESADELTRQELVLARLTLIQETAAFQAGAFADQQDTLTAQSQRLRVNFEELQETIGKGLVPAVSGLVKGLNESFDAFNAAASGAKNFGSQLPIVGDEIGGLEVGGLVEDLFRLNTQAVLLGPVFGPIALGMKLFGDETEETANKLTVFDKIAGTVAGTLGGLSNALDKVTAGLPSQAQRDDLSLTLAQAGGDQAGELAILQQREQRQAAFLERLLEEPALTGKAIALQQKAADNLKQTRERIKTILAQQATDANKAASEASKLRNDADQALLRMLGGQQDQARNRILAAQGNEGLKDDLRFNIAFRELLERQVDIVRASVEDAGRKAQELRTLAAALIRVGNDIKDIRQRIREAQREATEQRLERAQRSTELDIELADLNENTNRQIALRLRLIAQLKKEARVLKLQGNALKENRNERARIRQEIEDIQNEDKQASQGSARQDAAKFFFEQLQAQQGFAANLLGNLIPRDQTAGLVGVPAPTTGPGRGISTAAAVQEGKSGAAPTAGQASTTNDLLLRILEQLKTLNGATATPEATHQRRVGIADMDGPGLGGR